MHEEPGRRRRWWRERWPIVLAAVVVVGAAVAVPLVLATGRAPRAATTTTTNTAARSSAPTTGPAPPTTGTTAPGAGVPVDATTPIRSLDWDDTSVPGGVCPGGTGTVALHTGRATGSTRSDVVTEAGGPVYGRMTGTHDVAVLDVWCSGSGGSAADELRDSLVVFADTSGSLQVLGTLPATRAAPATGVHVAYFSVDAGSVTVGPGEIVTHELAYAPSDATCCPGRRVTTTWRFSAGSFTPASTATPSWTVAPSQVPWATIGYPIDDGCAAGTGVRATVEQETAFVPTGGPPLVGVLVRCSSGAGTAPSALLVYDGAATPGAPDLLASLVTTTDLDQASSFSVTGARITITLDGFSSTTVPNCCPDVHTTATWTWQGTGFVAPAPETTTTT